MKCPYCNKGNMPAPPKTPRPFGKCPDCGRRSRAAITESKDGKTYVHYSATSGPKKHPDDVKKVETVRLSKNDKTAIENGTKHLTIINGRVTLAV